MGVDAEMFVRVKRAVPDDEVRKLRYALASAFGASRFFIHRGAQATGEALLDDEDEEASWDAHHRHCLHRTAAYRQDGLDIVPEPGETFLRVHLWTRYYGIGYERGDLPLILSVARFLRDLTGGEVWYGGDSSGICAQPLDEAYEAELWRHFVENQHHPYRTDFGGEGIVRPHCALCGNVPMRFYSYGNGGMSTKAACSGCGFNVGTEDGGRTWTALKEGQ